MSHHVTKHLPALQADVHCLGVGDPGDFAINPINTGLVLLIPITNTAL